MNIQNDVEKILHEQLQLLAEYSKRSSILVTADQKQRKEV